MSGKSGPHSPLDAASLRAAAEERLAVENRNEIVTLSLDETRRLLHELQVHQIELEMQYAELRRVQEELEISRARYFDLYDLAPVGYVTLDSHALICDANLTFAAQVGVPRKELAGKPFSSLIGTDPADQDIFYRRFRLLVATTKPQSCELHLARKDGPAAWVALGMSAGTAVGAAAAQYRVTVTDVSERHRTEEALHHALRTAAIGQLTGGIAHDFNNILASAMLQVEYLAETLEPKSTAAQSAQSALAAIKRGADLTKRLLLFGRRHVLRAEAVDLASLVRHSENLFGSLLGETIEYGFAPGPVPVVVWADPVILETALVNLALNARDAMANGGKLTIETARIAVPEATATAEGEPIPAGDFGRITVRDTGTGMDPETLARAVEPYFTTKPPGKGSGLGLSMVQGFVAQSGGFLTIDSTLGRGTAISMHFPTRDCTPTREPEMPAFSARVKEEKSVLLVEDDPLVLDAVQTVLESLGYRVVTAMSAAEALEAMDRGEAIDILLSDIVLPGGADGIVLARRALAQRPGLKTVLMSGYTERFAKIDEKDRREIGLEFIGKPFGRAQLAAVLARLFPPG